MTRIAKIERKTEYFPIVGEVKATNDEQGIIEGYLNYIGNIDFGDDRTMPGAFKRTLTDSYARKSAQKLDFLWPYLWNHDYNILPPGGIFDADEYKQGLYTKTRFNMDTQLGRELYSSFKMGTMKKQSMGYKAIKYEYVKEGGRTIRNLLEVAIMEGSAVVFPMNDLAVVDTVKSTGRSYFIMPGQQKTEPDKKDFNASYQARVQGDWLEDLWNLWFPLKQEILTAFQEEDPLEATRTALDQFSNAMLAYVQQGIDLGMVEALQPDEAGTPMMYMSNEPGQEAKAGRTISAANHSTMTKAVAGIMEHCKSINALLQSTKPEDKPEKSLGAAEPPQTPEAKEDDAVSTHLDELLASIQLANLGRQLKSR